MPSQRLSHRRDFLKAITLGTASAAILAACGAGAAPPPTAAPTAKPAAATPVAATVTPAAKSAATSPAKATEIEVWTGWTEQAATNIELILSNYSKSQDKYVAKHVVTTEMLTKLLASVAAGNPPGAAVIFNGSGEVYTLAEQGAILSMEGMGKEKLDQLKAWVAPAIWDLGSYKGKLYALAMWTQSYGIYYNAKYLKEEGFDAAKPPQDLDELEVVAEKLTKRDGSGNITRMGFDSTSLALWTAVHRGQLVNDDGTKVTANSPNTLAALEYIVNRWKKYDPKKIQDFNASLAGTGERSATLDPFIAGKRALNLTGPWHIGTIKQFATADFDWGVWPVPGPKKGQKAGVWTYGDVFIVPKGAKAPDASWDLVSAMTGATGDRDVYTNLFVVWPCVNNPVSPQMLDYPTFKGKVVDACKGYSIFTDTLFKGESFLYPPKIPTAASYMSMLNAEAEKARLQQKSAKEALDFVTQQAQKELDDWYAKQGKK